MVDVSVDVLVDFFCWFARIFTPRNRRVTADAKRRVAGGEDWGGEVRDSDSTLVAGSGTGQLGRIGRRLQEQERLRGGRGEQNVEFYERGVAFWYWGGGAGEEEERKESGKQVFRGAKSGARCRIHFA